MALIPLTVECDHSIHQQLKEDLRDVVDGDITIVERKNLDGTSAVLEIAQIIGSLAIAVTPIITFYLNRKDRKKIKRIRFGDIEIENPTKEQWEKVWNEYLLKTAGNKKNE